MLPISRTISSISRVFSGAEFQSLHYSEGIVHRVTRFGDTVFVTLLSPSDELVGNWLLGIGPTFTFPTTSNSTKWQIGATGVLGYLGENSSSGCFPQEWWSTAGPGSNTISQLNLQ